jgi:hypothetical protein
LILCGQCCWKALNKIRTVQSIIIKHGPYGWMLNWSLNSDFTSFCHHINTATVNDLFKVRTVHLSPALTLLGRYGINSQSGCTNWNFKPSLCCIIPFEWLMSCYFQTDGHVIYLNLIKAMNTRMWVTVD